MSTSVLQVQGQEQPPTPVTDDDPAEDQIYIEQETVDDGSAGYDSGEESEDKADKEQERQRAKRIRELSIASGMANLTLNDQLRPALSRVKSSPSLLPPVPEEENSFNPSFYAAGPRRAESTEDLPAHIRYPFTLATDNPQQYPYPYFPAAAAPNVSYVPGYGENYAGTAGLPMGTLAFGYALNPSAASSPSFPSDNGIAIKPIARLKTTF